MVTPSCVVREARSALILIQSPIPGRIIGGTDMVFRKMAFVCLWLGLAGAGAHAAGFEYNVTPTGLALRGYDPVAYFVDHKAEPGDFALTATHAGVTYRFASEAHRKLFLANPGKYVPQYGGYCAFGAARGLKVDADPEAWTVAGGKLYVNLAPKVRTLWEKDRQTYIGKADRNWPKIENEDPAALKP